MHAAPLAIDLRGKTALVTGAASGIGRATAMQLAACGANIAINDLNPRSLERLIPEIPNKALSVPGDISNEDDVERIFGIILGELGCIDILVNNAGVPEPIGKTADQRLSDWRQVIDVNLQGCFLMSRAAAQCMTACKTGNIINVSSIGGLNAVPASNAYGVSKAGVAMMTKTLACELARHNIRVNAVAPGIVDAPMAAEAMEGSGGLLKAFVRRTPLGRVAQAEEIASVIAFLASDLSAFITGVVLPVDGGWTAFGGAGDASRPSVST